MKKYNVAILGATGAVGTEFLQLCGAFAWGKKHRKIRGDRRGRLTD